MLQQLTLGTVQFGLNYGVSNSVGKVSPKEVESILDFAYENGISELDTAVAYGDSEIILGKLINGRFKVSTKLPKLDLENQKNVREWTISQIESSLDRLNVNQIETLFLHDVSILFSPNASEVYETIQDFVSKGVIRKFGLSIYSHHDLEKIPSYVHYNRIQCPINVFDRSLESRGWIDSLHKKGIEIQARSIFLQGILLMKKEARPKYFSKWSGLFEKWDKAIERNQISPTLFCILFIKSLEKVSNVVFGVESKNQLSEIISHFKENRTLQFLDELSSDDEDLIFPFRWQLK
ncbi:aldo/keto reductase [Leptospira levettii]|uniref:aldo/keto reductase n=1 Tax=Leptospira levettii TaxID=2023178 RepID=UPI00223DFD6F|nr:aldo/keto reductase [Leptospira levettii]MCW7509304.1 aldo/keto reductase [Leptospira levettii]MCW7520393.1 aldo/keto reductase [Leptospira levettii]